MNKEAFKVQEHYSYEDLIELIELLRSPEGCPWDSVQTHESVRRGVIEEAYEVAEAIDRKDPKMMTEELGDLLMQVLFHASIGAQKQEFTLQDVYDRICRKLIFRHPHLFDDAPDASGSTEEGWQRLKRLEKGQQSLKEDLEGIARTLPELTRAEKIAGKVFGKGDPAPLYAALAEQVETLAKTDEKEKALSELLFTVARLSKCLSIDPEAVLGTKNQKIIENS